MSLQAQWIKLSELRMSVWDQSYKENYITIDSSEAPNKNDRRLRIQNYNKHREFVIEGYPVDQKHVNCRKSLFDMVVEGCEGPIEVRDLNEFD